MGATTVPVKNQSFVFFVALVSQSNTKTYQANPTLAAGDVKVQTDDGSLANITTLPTGAASSLRVKVSLSAAEMNGDNIWVQFSDAAGAEWCDFAVNIQTSARGVDDLAYPATTGRSMVVSASGVVDAQVKAIDAGAITAAAIATDAIDADAIAASALTAAKFAAGAIDAAAVAADAANEIADALLDRASAVDTYTVRQILRGMAAVLMGKATGAQGAEVYRAVDDSANRVSATSSSGNRSAVTLNL